MRLAPPAPAGTQRTAISRRDLLAVAPFGALTLLAPTAAGAPVEPGPSATRDSFPRQPPSLVRDVVLHAHFDLDRVRALTDEWPELAKASWDWGFGDWESALGAASHTGRREIAALLVDRGARPNLFTHAMLGHLEVVRAAVAAQPGIQSIPGPHGITLLAHARAGGEPAATVVAYLQELGGADPAPAARPLPLPLEVYVGTYLIGDGDRTFQIVERDAGLRFTMEGTADRPLVHVGESLLHPVGAPSVRMRFRIEEDVVFGIEIGAGRDHIVAEKMGS